MKINLREMEREEYEKAKEQAMKEFIIKNYTYLETHQTDEGMFNSPECLKISIDIDKIFGLNSTFSAKFLRVR